MSRLKTKLHYNQCFEEGAGHVLSIPRVLPILSETGRICGNYLVCKKIRFVSEVARNPEDRFCRDAAYMNMNLIIRKPVFGNELGLKTTSSALEKYRLKQTGNNKSGLCTCSHMK